MSALRTIHAAYPALTLAVALACVPGVAAQQAPKPPPPAGQAPQPDVQKPSPPAAQTTTQPEQKATQPPAQPASPQPQQAEERKPAQPRAAKPDAPAGTQAAASEKTSKPAPAADKQPTEGQSLQIRAIKLTAQYEKGSPVEDARAFSTGPIFAVIELENEAREASQIFVSWAEAGQDSGWKGMPLDVPPVPRYRTVARTWATPRDPGAYRVLVRDAEGEVLAEQAFQIAR